MLLLTSSGFSALKHPDADGGRGGPLLKPMVAPNMQLRVHRVSKVFFSVTNYGKLGSEARRLYDPWTQEAAPSCEFPGNSNLEYLFQGCIWIGAVEEKLPDEPGVYDTLVSIGDDGWAWDVNELNPAPPPAGEILMLSTRGPNSPPYADSVGTLSRDIMDDREFHAVSEQDFISVFTDTIVIGVTPDDIDSRDHRPLGLKLIQKSYSWSYEYAEDFILFDFEIENIGRKQLEELWIGLYIDADVHHTSEPEYTDDWGAQNDICGFLTDYTDPILQRTSNIYTAWIADCRGMAYDGSFDYRSPRGLSGVRVVNWPGRNVDICDPEYDETALQYGFNWWISNSDATLDWGPQLEINYAKWGPFPGGGKGTPMGDKAKYQVMSNEEFDYDQIWCALTDWQDGEWINKAPNAPTLADGYDTRYLFSFGGTPDFDIQPGQVCTLTLAYICGENLHKYPDNWESNLEGANAENPTSIQQYYDNLGLGDFATNAQWAAWVYDNPGVDTDGNGCPGLYDLVYPGGDSSAVPDTFWYMGDGVPDFQGPPPPNSPRLDNLEIGKGYVNIRWTSINPGEPGSGSEDAADLFTGLLDFEGYGIYMSYDALNWALLCRYDMIDWLPLTYDVTSTPAQWVTNISRQNPVTTDSVFGLASDPAIEDTAWVEEVDRDTTHTYWVPYGHNQGFDEIVDDTVIVGGETVINYSYTVTGLSKSRGVYFAVTAFDYGNAQTNLSSLESAKSINAALVYPIEKSDPIMVYPNPYKATNTQSYIDKGYEDVDGSGWVEQDRRIWFSNLPDDQKTIIRIWSLDGDLIRVVTYDPTGYIGNPLGIVYWDLVSRNGQAVVSGLYLYSIEFIAIGSNVENKESEIGKLVIIK